MTLARGALAALLPLLIAQHHFNYAIAATLVFAMNLVSSIIQPLFGFLSDRFRTGWIIIPALLINIGRKSRDFSHGMDRLLL
ncbi:hypothetical protein VPJ60_06110, partial [Limosilactobacillus fermentum]